MESVVYRPLKAGASAVVELGNEVRGATSEEFRSVVRHLLARGIYWIAMDFRSSWSADSMAIGVLLMAQKLCSEQGGAVLLLKPSKAILSLLQVLQVHSYFPVVEDEESILERIHQAKIKRARIE